MTIISSHLCICVFFFVFLLKNIENKMHIIKKKILSKAYIYKKSTTNLSHLDSLTSSHQQCKQTAAADYHKKNHFHEKFREIDFTKKQNYSSSRNHIIQDANQILCVQFSYISVDQDYFYEYTSYFPKSLKFFPPICQKKKI